MVAIFPSRKLLVVGGLTATATHCPLRKKFVVGDGLDRNSSFTTATCPSRKFLVVVVVVVGGGGGGTTTCPSSEYSLEGHTPDHHLSSKAHFIVKG